MLLAINFGVGCKTGMLSSRIGSSRIGSSSLALVFTNVLAFLGISNPGRKLAHLHLDELPICVLTQLLSVSSNL